MKDRIGARRSSRPRRRAARSSRAAPSSRRPAATPASASPSPRPSRATAASSPCRTRCRRRRCGCCAPSGAEVIVMPTAVPPDHPDYYVKKAQAHRGGDARTRSSPTSSTTRPTPRRTTRRRGPRSGSRPRGASRTSSAAPGTGGTVSGVGPLPEGEEPACRIDRRRSRGLHLHGVRARPTQKGEGTPTRSRASAATRSRRRCTSTSSTSGCTCQRRRRPSAMARRLTREEGLFVGGSAGLNVHVALEVARAGRRPRRRWS